jgi:hypothetical protein
LGAVVLAQIPTETGPPPTAQIRLDQYLHDSEFGGEAEVLALERARRPWQFSRDLGYTSYGYSVYYQTDAGGPDDDPGNRLPLPYPPQELWCVLLARDGYASGEVRVEQPNAVVFVGLHMDLYNADWLVHGEARDLDSGRLREHLDRLGCELGLD